VAAILDSLAAERSEREFRDQKFDYATDRALSLREIERFLFTQFRGHAAQSPDTWTWLHEQLIRRDGDFIVADRWCQELEQKSPSRNCLLALELLRRVCKPEKCGKPAKLADDLYRRTDAVDDVCNLVCQLIERIFDASVPPWTPRCRSLEQLSAVAGESVKVLRNARKRGDLLSYPPSKKKGMHRFKYKDVRRQRALLQKFREADSLDFVND
jgi:hypothetical protein